MLEMRSISKSFNGGQVLFDVDLTVQAGEVHALLGQNGAGKSTLMKVLAGLYPDHSGTVRVDGSEVKLSSVAAAGRAGVTVIHQEFSLIPKMTVAENLVLAREPGPPVLLDKRKINAEAKRWVDDLHLNLPLDRQVGRLGVAQQQLTEIAKAVSRETKVLVMDEPTARLPEQDRELLFSIIRDLAARGVAIVYISHFLEEVLAVSDTVTVLRDGRRVGTQKTSELDARAITAMMIGTNRENQQRTRPEVVSPEPLLQVEGLAQAPYLRPVDLTVGRGEVVALAGLVGAGRTRLARNLIGAERRTAGTITINGKSHAMRGPGQALLAGVALVPEDRKTQGLDMSMSARGNILTMALRKRFVRGGLINHREGYAAAKTLFEQLEVRPVQPTFRAGLFSGGNQQKVVLAKALASQTPVLILDQPTAGVDVVTKAEIHGLVDALASEGKGVLLISDDVDEILRLADRVVLMGEGKVLTESLVSQTNHAELVRQIGTSRSVASKTDAAGPAAAPVEVAQ